MKAYMQSSSNSMHWIRFSACRWMCPVGCWLVVLVFLGVGAERELLGQPGEICAFPAATFPIITDRHQNHHHQPNACLSIAANKHRIELHFRFAHTQHARSFSVAPAQVAASCAVCQVCYETERLDSPQSLTLDLDSYMCCTLSPSHASSPAFALASCSMNPTELHPQLA